MKEKKWLSILPYVLVLHEAHEISEQVRDRLRALKRHYDFPKGVIEKLAKAGIDLTDKLNDSDAPPF